MELLFWLPLLDRAATVETISLAVSLTVIILMALAFGGLFVLYFRYLGKCVDHSLEDESISKEILKEHRGYFVKIKKLFDEKERSEPLPSFEQYREEKEKRSKGLKIFANVCLGIFYLLFVALMVTAVHIRLSGDLFNLAGSYYLVIQTPSMEEKNPFNGYLEGHDDQIDAYTLIDIAPLEEGVSPELYDICAFHGEDGMIIVHRLIEIDDSGDEVLYTFRGDANSGSADYETDLTVDEIIGVYNGYSNFGLGLAINYLRSNIGIITVAIALIVVGFYDVLDIKLGKNISCRKEYLYAEMESSFTNAYEKGQPFPYYQYLPGGEKERTEKLEHLGEDLDQEVKEEKGPKED